MLTLLAISLVSAVAREWLPGPFGALRSSTALTELQNALGRANDLHIGIHLLNSLPRKSIALSFDLGRLEGAMQVEAARHTQISATIWRRLAESRRFWRE